MKFLKELLEALRVGLMATFMTVILISLGVVTVVLCIYYLGDKVGTLTGLFVLLTILFTIVAYQAGGKK